MSNVPDQYSELIALTRLYLHREVGMSTLQSVEKQSFLLFQEFFKKSAPKFNIPLQPLQSMEKAIAPLSSINQVPLVKKPEVASFSPTSHSIQDSSLKETIPNISTVVVSPDSSRKTQSLSEPKEQGSKILKTEKEIGKKSFSNESLVHFLKLEPLSKPTSLDLSDVKKTVFEHCTKIKIIESIPNDTEAKEYQRRHEHIHDIPNVVILSFDDLSNHFSFLVNIVHALKSRGITSTIFSAKKIEEKNEWEKLLDASNLRLIVASDYGIYMLAEFMKRYKELPKQSKRFVDKIPLFLLSDISLYLKEPMLKPSLWKALCAELKLM